MLNRYYLKLSAQRIEKKIKGYMPIEFQKYSALLSLENPVVDIESADSAVIVCFDFKFSHSSGLSRDGYMNFKSGLRYDSDNQQLFLHKPVIDTLDVSGLTPFLNQLLRQIAQWGVKQYFSRFPFYVLDDKSLKHKFASSLLKSVVIKDKMVWLELVLYE